MPRKHILMLRKFRILRCRGMKDKAASDSTHIFFKESIRIFVAINKNDGDIA